MEFACLRCGEHVRVALGADASKLAEKNDQPRLELEKARGPRQENAATEQQSDTKSTQKEEEDGVGTQERLTVERAQVTRCRRCDGLFHTKCVAGEGDGSLGYECIACKREDAVKNTETSSREDDVPLLVPVQVLGVLKKDDGEMASDEEEDDWNELAVFTEDIQVCLTCRRVHLAAEELLPCAQCNAVGQLHRRCVEAAPPVAKSPGRKRKRSGSKTGVVGEEPCASCAGETTAAAVGTRRLALLMKPDDSQWWETCGTCQGEFCLHALVSDDSEDDDELHDRLGRCSDAGFQCRACSTMPDIQSPRVGEVVAAPVVASVALYEEALVVEEDEGTVLICDGCEGEFAMATLDPPLLEVPEGDWYCSACKPPHTEQAAPMVVEVVVTLLICDGCEGEFEMSPLDTVPDGDWFCNHCVQNQEATSRPTEDVPAPEPAPQKNDTVIVVDVPMAIEDVAVSTDVSTDVAAPSVSTDSRGEGEADLSLAVNGEAASSGDANLIECDGCDDKYDARTIGPVSPDMPKGDWFCDNCEATRKRRKKGYAAMKMEKLRRLRAVGDERAISLALEVAKQQLPRQTQAQPVKKVAPLPRRQASLGPSLLAPVTLLICDGCEGEFDMATLNPPLASIPKGDWFCSGCAGHANGSNRRKLVASSAACSSCAAAVRWDRNAQRAATRNGGVVLCESCAHRKLEAQALQSAAEAEKKRKRDSFLQPHDGRVNVDPSERIFMPVPVAVTYGTATSNGSSTSSAAAGNIAAYGSIVCSDDEGGDGLHGHSDDDDEHVIIVCEICLSEFDMIDVFGESHIAPPRPWYCTPCVKRLKKNRKKKQRISKQMMLEMQLYGGLLRPTAAKFVDPISRALRGKKPTSDEELLTLLELVGKRVGIMLSWDKHWVMGRVLSFDPASCVHVVRFDDESERGLPLFAFPIVIGTGTIVEVKVPASQNLWRPAEILKMNAIAERQLEQSLEDTSLLKAFRLVNLISATIMPGKPSNVACWTPRHLCRSMPSEGSGTSPEGTLEYDLAKKRATEDSQETRKIRRSVFGALLRKAHDSRDSEEVWHAVAQAIVGSTVVVDENPNGCFKVEGFDASSGRHQLKRRGDEGHEVVNILERAGRVELEDARSLAKVALVLHKALRDIIDMDTTPDGDDAEEITIVQNTSVSIRPPPPSSELQCGKCGLPPVVDGDSTVTVSDASLVECVQCSSSFHSYCCDPPHDTFPLVSSEDGGAVLVNDIQTPFVCRSCVSCAGCGVTSTSSWFRWRLPLEVVTLCEDCVRIYDDKCQCAVCNTAIDETMQDDSPSLLKCSACDLWVHPLCEPDTHPVFRRRLTQDEQEFELDIRIPLPDLNAAHVDDGDDEEDEEPVAGKKYKGGGNSSTVAAKTARLIEEGFAFDLKFKETYDARVLHNYECLTCRKVRMLRALHRLRLEDKLDLFKEPVTKTIAPTYFDVIKQPMDLSTMQRRVLDSIYKRVNFRDFRDDFELLCLNAVTFNSRDRDFLIWREAWRFYGQGQRVLRQIVPKSRMKQRGGKNYDALVLAAKRQLPNNSLAGKTKGEIGGDDGDDGDEDEDEDDEMDEDGGEESPDTGLDENGEMGAADAAERNDGDKMVDEATQPTSSAVNDEESSVVGTPSVNAADASVSLALVKTTFERKRAPQLAAGLSFTPQSELGSVPKPHSSYSLYVTMHSRSSSHAYAWIDVCGQCGTRGSSDDVSETLVFCVDCGEGFHSFCAGVDEQKLLKESSQLQSSWRCKNCEMCELCGKPHEHVVEAEDEEAKWMVCSHCDRSFHGKCLLPAVRSDSESMDGMDDDSGRREDSFYCANCVHCKNCGKAASPASYSYDRELCLNCCQAQKSEQSLLSAKTKGLLQVWTADARKQRKNAEKCPMCRSKWTAEDEDLIQCDACERWAHPLCDPMFVDDAAKYDALVQDPNAQYVCTVCRRHDRDHLSEIPDLAKCQLFIAKIQRTRSLCDARWKEARTQMRQAQKWQEWKENVAIYLYVLRIGEECVKGLAYRSVNFHDDWARVTSSKYKDLDVPAWLLQKASRYLRYKRYARGPRAATRKLTRKNENFYSQQGVEKQKEPHAIATIAAQAASCAALIVSVHLLYGWAPLQRVVFHLLEREGHAHGERLSQTLIKALLVDNKDTLEDEIATIKRQYERRAGKKHLLRLQAEDDEEIDESEISPTGSSVSSLALDATNVEAAAVTPAEHEVNAEVAVTTTVAVVREPIRLTRATAMSKMVDDSRFCALCFIVGETPACGRLIYVELDQWVHLNCALWSSEVYEDTAGVLHKCQKALSRSKTNRCDGCGVLGATIGCAVSRCQRHYHFPCALDHGVVFLPSSETCCPMPAHIQQIAKMLEVPELTNMAWTESPAETIVASLAVEDGVADTGVEILPATAEKVDGDAATVPEDASTGAEDGSIAAVAASALPSFVLSSMIKAPRRCIRVDFSSIFGDTKKRMNALHLKRQVGFRIGSLTVHSLGHVVIGNPSFYSREAVFPLGFRSTRIYWSSRAVATRCVYECVVTSTDVEARTKLKGTANGESTRVLSSPKALFQITASDDVENPIIAASPTEALLELRSRIIALYEEALSSDNPFLRRRSWFSYGLLGHHFFGFGIPEIAREIETLPHVATTAIRRSYVLQRHRQQLQAARKRRRGQDHELLGDENKFGDHVYVFSYRLPSATEMALAMREVEQVVEAEEHARISTGAVRTDGLEREVVDEAEAAAIKATRRRLNKDATRDSQVQLPSEKTGASSAANAAASSNSEPAANASSGGGGDTGKDKQGVPMDLEHLPIAMQYRELRRRPFSERLEVRKSKIHGYGLFTKDKFMEGGMIVEYQGQMISQDVADVREKQYEEQGIGSCYMFRLDERTIIDATRCGNLARFMNHSCDPKAFARVVTVENNEKKIVIFAKRTIEAGEEVTYDYKFPIEDEAIRCDCGAPNCIGRMN